MIDESGIGRTASGVQSFTLEFKLQFLREYDQCVEPGAKTELKRRYNVSNASLANWRKNRAEGRCGEAAAAAAVKPRRTSDVNKFRAEAAKWKARAEAAEEKARKAEAAQVILGKAFELLEEINSSSTPASQIPSALMSAEEYRLYLQRLQLS
ncbi:MAG: hypothetical protein QM658_00240 [Gordonia sp. (in: high G+C Gram-positive bacteria)]